MYVLVQHDDELGPTIVCEDMAEAISQAVQLGAENGYAFTSEDSEEMWNGGVMLPNGSRLSIGQLEPPRTEH